MQPMVNPTIQDRAMESADAYWQKVLRVKELRVLYGLQNPKNNKPLVSPAVKTHNEFTPKINRGWSSGYTTVYYNDVLYELRIRDNTLIIQADDQEIPVISAPADVRGKNKEKFLRAVAWTITEDPDNIRSHIPGMPIEYDRFNLPGECLE